MPERETYVCLPGMREGAATTLFLKALNLGGFSLANTDAGGNVTVQAPAVRTGRFGSGNGLPPVFGTNIVYNDFVGSHKLDLLGIPPSTDLTDFVLDDALCQRTLVTGAVSTTGRVRWREQRW